MDLSIIIVNWNTKKLLEESVSSIFKYTKNLNFEVIVYDNGSADGSVQMLTEKFPEVVRIESKNNDGFVVGNTEGYSKSRGKYILLLNSDAYLVSDELGKMVDVLEQDESIGVLGPRLEYANGKLQKSVRTFPTVFSQALVLLKVHNLFPGIKPIAKYYMNDFDYSVSSKVDQVMGAALLTRRSVIEKIGFLDKNFWAWFEEVDYCKRVVDAGYEVYYYSEARVRHHKGQSFKNLTKRQKLFNTSMAYYFSKHFTSHEVFLLKMLMPFSVVTSFVLQALVKLIPISKNKDL